MLSEQSYTYQLMHMRAAYLLISLQMDKDANPRKAKIQDSKKTRSHNHYFQDKYKTKPFVQP